MIVRERWNFAPHADPDGYDLRSIDYNHPMNLTGPELKAYLDKGGCVKVVDGKLYACYNPDYWRF